ncbi:unnamed protein product [Brachionus calyciflorus]|uniref:Uncharacterized protein n=1 Tax=Brachionus calyciflorus TaxID=104777 RepID=A0A814HP24_9BILA|nr:unnamed protein product [Brachionus calyciflorus]
MPLEHSFEKDLLKLLVLDSIEIDIDGEPLELFELNSLLVRDLEQDGELDAEAPGSFELYKKPVGELHAETLGSFELDGKLLGDLEQDGE